MKKNANVKIRIYNTITHQKNRLTEEDVGVYVCGPTVYDVPHIGHARSAYVFDNILKYLKARGKKITFVRNVTDIDDKIIIKAQLELKKEGQFLDRSNMQAKVKQVSEFYLKAYQDDMDILGILTPDHEPKATETIKEMIEFIEILIKKDYAYTADGNVYFDVRKFKDYGRLSGQSQDQMEEGARVALDKNKKDPLDFALWKASKENEPSWDSPWGKGRPGWHIECSVMSTKFLKEKFLIHGGGLDLVFPHHENEIAQTVCAGKKSAKYWIHHGLLTINGQKMSKSLGNYVTVKDFIGKYKNINYLRLFFLSAHYSSPIDYTEDNVEEAKKKYERFDIFFRTVARKYGKGPKRAPAGGKFSVKQFRQKFEEAMDDDFNTPLALGVLFNLVRKCNKILGDPEDESKVTLRSAVETVKELLSVLGLGFENAEEKTDQWVEMMKNRREALRKEKKYKEADDIRKEIEAKNIILEDTKEGTIWRRKN